MFRRPIYIYLACSTGIGLPLVRSRFDETRKRPKVRFGSVVRCFFGGSVWFGSLENFDRTTNVNFFKLFSQTFRTILNTLIGTFDDFLEKYLDRKNLVWFRSVRFGSVTEIRFSSVR